MTPLGDAWFVCAAAAGVVAGGAVFGLLLGGVWLVKPAVVLPAGGGFGASTIPFTGGAVEGVGNEFTGTEFVTGTVDAVGETLFGLPRTLFAGWGIAGEADGAALAAPPEAACVPAGFAAEEDDAAPGSASSGSDSVASYAGEPGGGGEIPPVRGLSINSSGA